MTTLQKTRSGGSGLAKQTEGSNQIISSRRRNLARKAEGSLIADDRGGAERGRDQKMAQLRLSFA